METLQITKENAQKAYKAGCSDVKKVLENLFGSAAFIQQKITDRVKSFEDACDVLGIDPEDVFDDCIDASDEIAFKKLKVIVKALNEGWIPNWNNSDQRKWYPWFYMDDPGFRFFDSLCGLLFTVVGSRLCFASEEISNYAGNQFIDLYKLLFTL